jgi:hypothetical protein
MKNAKRLEPRPLGTTQGAMELIREVVRPPSQRAIRHVWLTDPSSRSTGALMAPTASSGCMPSCGLAWEYGRHNAGAMAVQTRMPPAGASSTLTRRCCSLLGVIQRAKDSALVPSMGGVAECYDNAMIEAFWSRCGSNCWTGSAGTPVSSWQRDL